MSRHPFLRVAALLACGLAPAYAQGGLVSDDFNGCGVLESQWTALDPLGDATFELSGWGSSDARIAIGVPAGTAHDASGTSLPPRIVQPVVDEDFTIEVEFESQPLLRYQLEGLVLEQDPQNWLRFDFWSKGNGVRVFAAETIGGVTTTRYNSAISSGPTGTPLYLRVARTGDQWTQSWSLDGQSWQTAASFSSALVVTTAGVMAGNAGGSPPAFTALCDYFFETATPIVPEDGELADEHTLATEVLGGGTVTVDPDQPAYSCVDLVEVLAVPDPGSRFDHWEGDLSGGVNPVELFMNGDKLVRAVFAVDDGSPIITDVAVAVTSTTALVTWTTNEPADSLVEYGPDAGYGQSQSILAHETEHSIPIEGLTPLSQYHFRVTSTDPEGHAAITADDVFLTEAPGAVRSADFDRCDGYASFWTAVDPLGDALFQTSGAGTPDAWLSIVVPGGVAHEAFGENRAPRLMQPALDQDFVIEVKFESLPSAKYQAQGILVEQDADDWLRFDVYSTGTKTMMHAASTVGGVSTTLYSRQIAAALPFFLRVTRSGNQFVESWSTNGTSYTNAATFSRAMVMTQAGVFAGNSGSNPPAYTALVDYFFDAEQPIVPEDGGVSGGGPFELDVDAEGSGSVARQPDEPLYDCGELVSLTATPAPGWTFVGWEGDLDGSANRDSLVISHHSAVVAVFHPDGPPVITDIAVDAGEISATVTWRTNEPATSFVEWGPTTSYGSSASDGALVTEHLLVLEGLTPGTQYHFRVASTDAQNDTTTSGDGSFTTSAGTGIVSDDFNGCSGLAPAWSIVDPLGGATFDVVGAGTQDAQLLIGVPAGASHDPFDVNRAPRVMQTVNDVDFQVEARFQSVPAVAYQVQGFIVEQDAANWLRFDVYSNGTKRFVYAARTVNGQSQTLWSLAIGSQMPGYLRVTRSGDQFTQHYSSDGQSWIQAGSTTHVMGVTSLGVFAANAGSNAPAFTGIVDYFFDTANPKVPEDGPTSDGPFTLTTSVIGQGTVQRQPDLGSYSCGTEVVLTATSSGAWRFDHWEDGLGGFQNPATLVVDADEHVRAVFVLDENPPIISDVVVTPGSTSALVTWTTNEPATSRVDYGTTSGYGQDVQSSALVVEHSLLLTPLLPSTEYHYRITSVDGSGLSASTLDATFTTTSGSGVTPDDFNRFNLRRPLWGFVDPKNDGTLALINTGTVDAQLALGVPAGSAHDPFGTNQSVRVMQAADDADFDLAVKLESDLSQRFQIQGLIVEQDPQTWIRFDLHYDGSRVRAYCATHAAGVPTTRGNVVIFTGAWIDRGPIWMRVTRTGDSWLYRYSFDGTAWTTAVGPFVFALDVAAMGPFVGNAASGSNPAPAHTAIFDWLQDLGSPLPFEDVGVPVDAEPPYLYRVATGQVFDTTARVDSFTDESTTGWVEYGLTSGYELGATPIIGPGHRLSHQLLGLTPGTTYHYRVVTRDANLATTTSTDRTFTTTDGGPGGNVPFFDVWYGSAQGDGSVRQRFGHLGIPQTWVNVLGNVIDPDGNVTSLTWSLNGGSASGLNLGPDSRRLENPGDFCVEIPYASLLPGDNQVLLTATDDDGNQTQQVVVVEYTSGVQWPTDYAVDWTSSGDVQDLVQIVDGKWTLGEQGLSVVEWGYDRLFAFGDITHTDYEVTMPLTVHELDPEGYAFPSNGPAVGLGMRWTGHTGNGQPRWGFWPTGCFAWYRWGPNPPQFELRTNQYQDSEFHPLPLELGVPWIFKTRCQSVGNGTTQYSFKFWKAAETEPAEWILQVLGTPTDPQAGSILVLAHHANVDFGTITVVPGPFQ